MTVAEPQIDGRHPVAHRGSNVRQLLTEQQLGGHLHDTLDAYRYSGQRPVGAGCDPPPHGTHPDGKPAESADTPALRVAQSGTAVFPSDPIGDSLEAADGGSGHGLVGRLALDAFGERRGPDQIAEQHRHRFANGITRVLKVQVSMRAKKSASMSASNLAVRWPSASWPRSSAGQKKSSDATKKCGEPLTPRSRPPS